MSGGLESFFAPRGIAIIGASADPGRAGARALANLPKFGYAGAIHPVTRRGGSILGYPAYSSVAEVPDPVDLAVICVASARVPDALRECGQRGIEAAVVFAAGFGSATEESRRLQAELEAAQRESGVRVLGPNTVGTRLVHTGVFATFAHDVESGVTPGSVAMVAQSGGLGVYFGSSFLRRYGVGTRYLVDTGNELDVCAADVLEYVADDPEVSCVALILEGAHDGRRLMDAVRTAAARKPVMFLKTGRSHSAAEHVTSHTGALVGSAALFEAAMRSAGALVVSDESELVDALRIYEAGNAPRGRRLGVVTPSGGYAILTIDAAERYGMEIPPPATAPEPDAVEALSSGALANPYDYTSISDARPDTLARGIGWMVSQPNVDAVLVWQAYMLEIEERRRLLLDALDRAPDTDVPVFGCGLATPEFQAQLRERGVLWFEEPTRLVRALSLTAPPAAPSTAVPSAAASGNGVVVGEAARSLLPSIEHVVTEPAADAEAARALATRFGRVVVKVESAEYPHKSEFGLVSAPVAVEDAARAWSAVAAARQRVQADAPVVVQRCETGIELALGGYLDPVFGASVMVAMGGIDLEIVRDVALAVAPVSEQQARSLILSLRGAPLLCGARGRSRADVDAAARALVALSQFMAHAEGRWQSVDINPLVVRPEGQGAVAVDALLVPNSHTPVDG